jgi:hypothetical protein
LAFLGNLPTSATFAIDSFNGDNSTVNFTLREAPVTTSSILVFVGGIRQHTDTYSLSSTTLTFSEAPPTGTNNIQVLFLGLGASPHIPSDFSVSTVKIQSSAVTGDKIGLTSINANNIVNASITGNKIGLTAITSNLIAAAAVTGDKIGLTAITSNLIAANAITTAAISDGAINTSELAAGAVTGDKIGLTAINANNIVNASITGNKIGLTAITSNLIATTLTTGNLNLSGATSFLSTVFETANVTTLMGANTTINVAQPLVVFTANSSANSTVNFTGLAGMPVGNTVSFTIINPNSSTAKYISTYQVDGSATIVKWAGGSPTGGTSANTDIYSFSIIKTSATPTYNVFASVQSFF